jgi:hypothetical protein
MCASGIEWREERLQRSARCQDVVHKEHSRTWRNLKATTKLATRGSVSTAHLLSEEPAHTE